MKIISKITRKNIILDTFFSLSLCLTLQLTTIEPTHLTCQRVSALFAGCVPSRQLTLHQQQQILKVFFATGAEVIVVSLSSWIFFGVYFPFQIENVLSLDSAFKSQEKDKSPHTLYTNSQRLMASSDRSTEALERELFKSKL